MCLSTRTAKSPLAQELRRDLTKRPFQKRKTKKQHQRALQGRRTRTVRGWPMSNITTPAIPKNNVRRSLHKNSRHPSHNATEHKIGRVQWVPQKAKKQNHFNDPPRSRQEKRITSLGHLFLVSCPSLGVLVAKIGPRSVPRDPKTPSSPPFFRGLRCQDRPKIAQRSSLRLVLKAERSNRLPSKGYVRRSLHNISKN